MENYIVLIIAVENYHNPQNLRQVKFALNDASEIIESLVKLGCDKSKIEYLHDNLATKTTITEKIKEIARNAMHSETIVFYYAGHGFLHNGKNLISCVDTSLNNLPSTTVELSMILNALDDSKSNKVIAFLDCCHSGIEFSENERSPISNITTDTLKYEYKDAEHLIVFASCKSNERSQADIERKHGVWSYFLIQALSGKAKSIYDGAILFSDKLQKYLAENTYNRVKMITPEKKNQTPVKFGKETTEKFIVADLSILFAENEIKPNAEGIKFEKATILASEEDFVRNLPGFLPDYKAPKQIDSYHESWIKKIATKLIENELNDIAKILKQKLKYKRKDIQEPLVNDGTGQLSTMDFDYKIKVTQSQDKAGKFILTRSIENFKNSDILNNPVFNKIFSETFNKLELRVNKRLSVANVIDKIEEIENEEFIRVEYELTDVTNCRIIIKDFAGQFVLTETTLSIQMIRKDSPQNLVLSFQGAYQSMGQLGVQKLLG